MTDQITVPRANWDAMREALGAIISAHPVSTSLRQTDAVIAAREALTAANAVSAQPLSKQLQGKDYPADWLEFADKMQAAKAVQPQAQGEAWVWNPSSTEWEKVRAFGHWRQGAIYAFGQSQPQPIAHPQATEPAWRPIETAPKDGRKIIVTYANRNGLKRTVMACWLTDEAAAETDTDDVGLEEGWYECIDNWNDYTEIAIHEGEPSHWMPLPASPEAKQ